MRGDRECPSKLSSASSALGPSSVIYDSVTMSGRYRDWGNSRHVPHTPAHNTASCATLDMGHDSQVCPTTTHCFSQASGFITRSKYGRRHPDLEEAMRRMECSKHTNRNLPLRQG